MNNEEKIIELLTEIRDSLKKPEPKKRGKAFVPPTHGEVLAYCLERGKDVNAMTFMNHYESNGWKVGKNKMKDWRACIRTWEMRAKNKKTYAPKSMSKLDAQINEWQKAKELL